MYGVGTILAGKYRIERMIGEGGMGMVVSAMHLHLGTQVALKFLHQDMAMNQQMAERFLREARASALLKSEHVCRVSDVGMLENGAPYIVMELLAGQDLSSLLRNHGPMPIHTAADYILQALVAIAEAHAAGIVHRDLKPGNLFWTQRPDGTALIKVLDFGIAKAPTTANFSLTQTSSVMGSPGYMSPEQLKSSKEVDPRSDIWSIGVVLYELVSGRTPFTGESITEVALRVAMDPIPPLPGAFPPAFEAVIARCLEKDPSRRFQDVAELAIAIAPFAGPRGGDFATAVTRVLRGHNAARTIAPGSFVGGVQTNQTGQTGQTGQATPTTLGAATGMVAGQAPRSRGILVGAIAGLAVVGIGVGVMMATRGGGDAKTTTPAGAPTVPPPIEAPRPDVTKTEAPRPDVTKPEAPKPDVTKTEAPTPDVTKPETPKPDVTKTATPKPDVTKTATVKPEPKVVKPPVKKPPVKKPPPRKPPEDVGDSRK